MPPDSKQAFKAEWEALECTEYTWALSNADNEMMMNEGNEGVMDDDISKTTIRV